MTTTTQMEPKVGDVAILVEDDMATTIVSWHEGEIGGQWEIEDEAGDFYIVRFDPTEETWITV